MQKYLTLLLIIVNVSVHGQKSLLMLQKRNTNKNVVYKIGDEVSFYTDFHQGKVTGKIISFEDSVIVFNGYRVDVRDIKALHIDEKTRWWLRFKPAQLLLLAGGAY